MSEVGKLTLALRPCRPRFCPRLLPASAPWLLSAHLAGAPARGLRDSTAYMLDTRSSRNAVLRSVFRAPREHEGCEYETYSGVRLRASPLERWSEYMTTYSASRRRGLERRPGGRLEGEAAAPDVLDRGRDLEAGESVSATGHDAVDGEIARHAGPAELLPRLVAQEHAQVGHLGPDSALRESSGNRLLSSKSEAAPRSSTATLTR